MRKIDFVTLQAHRIKSRMNGKFLIGFHNFQGRCCSLKHVQLKIQIYAKKFAYDTFKMVKILVVHVFVNVSVVVVGVNENYLEASEANISLLQS